MCRAYGAHVGRVTLTQALRPGLASAATTELMLRRILKAESRRAHRSAEGDGLSTFCWRCDLPARCLLSGLAGWGPSLSPRTFC